MATIPKADLNAWCRLVEAGCHPDATAVFLAFRGLGVYAPFAPEAAALMVQLPAEEVAGEPGADGLVRRIADAILEEVGLGPLVG